MVTDEELAARVAGGDEAALAELLHRYERGLASFLHRQTGGRDAEDLFQETWLRVVRHADRFDPTRKFSTWMFQIAVNLARDWHRRPPLEPAEPNDRAFVPPASDRADVEIDAARLHAALPEEQREVLVLRFYHDLREEDVAEILGVPRGTVKSRAHNALKKLAAMVESDDARRD